MTWLDEVIKVYGMPRRALDKAVKAEDEFGFHGRRAWTWFPNNVNHHVSISHYNPGPGRPKEFWVLRVGSHKKRSPQVELKLAHEPTDFDVMECLDICMFLLPQEEIQDQLKSESVLSMTISIR